MTSVFVTGHRGMLGSTVSRYLTERGHEVLTSDTRFDGSADDPLVREIVASDTNAVINCAGVVTKRPGAEMMLANGIWPSLLAAGLNGRLLIHPSSDCVFDGTRGGRRVSEAPDATDYYGLSKRIGEACLGFEGVYILRTSIVGPPGDAGRGLLGWYLRQDGVVDGYVDHIWNGITTLSWAKIATGIIESEGLVRPGLSQPATVDTITKYSLLELFAEVFGHSVPIRRTEAGRVDRSLVPTLAMPPIHEQLDSLREWM